VVGVVILTALLLLAWMRERQRLYRVTILPSLGGKETAATGINNRGQVTGFAATPDGTGHFFLWDRVHGMRDLGPALLHTTVHINDAGQIAGTTEDAGGNPLAFFWDPARGVQMLGTLGGKESVMMGLNNHGQVVGRAQTAGGPSHAFVWDESAGMCDLGTLGGAKSIALAINDAGQVLGQADSATREYQGFWWERDKGMTAVGPAPSRDGREPLWCGMNNRGFALAEDDNEAFLWHKDAGIRRLFPPHLTSSYIYPVMNDANQFIFGEGFYIAIVPRWTRKWVEPTRHCYLWDPVCGTIPLDRDARPRPGENFYAWGLNDKGCIVGALYNERRMRARAVLLEPIPERWRRR
jgi:probable HAF family extracellular repeat protein